MACCGTNADIPIISGKDTDPGTYDLDEQSLRHLSRQLEDGRFETQFFVPKIHCVNCIKTLEKGIGALTHVEAVRVNLSMRSVKTVWNAHKGSGVAIEQKIAALGFEAIRHDFASKPAERLKNQSRQLLLAMAVAGFASANIMLLSVAVWSGADPVSAQLFHLISALIAIPAVFIGGRPFFLSALSALKAKRLNMDVPISLAVLLALIMSLYESLIGGKHAYFDAAVGLLFFLLIGRYLDELMRQKARSAVEQLSNMAAGGANLIGKDGKLEFIGTKAIRPGMLLKIFPGERLCVDGVIVKGQTDLDRSLVTGESEAVPGKKGDRVEAGIVNLSGVVEMKATSSAENSFLAEITKMMEAAENGRGRIVDLAERATRIYAPLVHLLALIAFLGWMFFTGGDWHRSIMIAIAVLIITCPCALGLAVPVVHVIGAARLLKQGIILRQGSALERLGQIDHIVFDKTGTLTDGKAKVTKAFGDMGEFLPTLKTLSAASNHPAAKAISAFIEEQFDRKEPKPADLTHIRELPGLGVEARSNGKIIRLGRAEWVSEIIKTARPAGSKPCFAVQGGPMVQFDIADQLRPDARKAVDQLCQNGFEISIVSGDSDQKVRIIANNLGIEQVTAEAKPGEKIEYIKALHATGKKVLMVGDGLNDAPALAQAHVSMAPGSACDIGKSSADFVFTGQSLLAVPEAIDVSGYAAQLVRQNFAIAIGYNFIAVPLAMTGHVTPLIAALAMSASSISVIANSMRLNFYDGKSETIKAQTVRARGSKSNRAKPAQASPA